MNDSPVPLDREALLRQFGGIPEIVDRVLTEFLKALPETLAELEAGLAAADAPAVRHAAHKIKGGLRTLCAQPGAEAARAIEEAAGQDLTQVPLLLPTLQARLAELRAAVTPATP